MAGQMGWFQYISDNGTTYRVRQDSTNAGAVGAAAEDDPPTHERFPGTWEPRYLLAEYLADPNGDGTNTVLERRKIICPDPTEGVWTGGSNSVTLPSYVMPPEALQTTPERMVTFTVRGRFGEKRPDR